MTLIELLIIVFTGPIVGIYFIHYHEKRRRKDGYTQNRQSNQRH